MTLAKQSIAKAGVLDETAAENSVRRLFSKHGFSISAHRCKDGSTWHVEKTGINGFWRVFLWNKGHGGWSAWAECGEDTQWITFAKLAAHRGGCYLVAGVLSMRYGNDNTRCFFLNMPMTIEEIIIEGDLA